MPSRFYIHITAADLRRAGLPFEPVTRKAPCVRCGGTGVYLNYGTCFLCGGSKVSGRTEAGFSFPSEMDAAAADDMERAVAVRLYDAQVAEGERIAAKRAGDITANREAWHAAYPTVFATLSRGVRLGADVDHAVLAVDGGNIHPQANDPGEWSKLAERVHVALGRAAARLAKDEAAKAAGVSCPSGRVPLVGQVMSRRHDGKGFVLSDAGWRAWGTLIDNAQKGDRVAWVATVEPSKDDTLSGFFSRAKKT